MKCCREPDLSDPNPFFTGQLAENKLKRIGKLKTVKIITFSEARARLSEWNEKTSEEKADRTTATQKREQLLVWSAPQGPQHARNDLHVKRYDGSDAGIVPKYSVEGKSSHLIRWLVGAPGRLSKVELLDCNELPWANRDMSTYRWFSQPCADQKTKMIIQNETSTKMLSFAPKIIQIGLLERILQRLAKTTISTFKKNSKNFKILTKISKFQSNLSPRILNRFQ